MKFYQITTDQVVKDLKTNIQKGLTLKQAKKRLQEHGPNIIPEKKPPSTFLIFIKQFLSPLMFILLFAAIISVLIGEAKDAIVISIAVAMNTILGFIQEFKAEKAAQALKKFEVKHCNVKRDGKIVNIEAKNLVPGDIVLLSAGSRVPADIKLTHVIDFTIQEAILTGEAKPITKNIAPIEKDVTVGDRFCMAFSGTNVLSGKAEGIVTKTGSQTYLGKVVELVTTTKKESTPLQNQIKKLSWFLGAIFLAVIIIIFFLGLIKGIPIHQITMIGIALAVAAIPEGLLVAVTVILAIGMQRMLKRHALVRHLIAAETLGSVSVICTDKTGTLTLGHMQVVKIITKPFDKLSSSLRLRRTSRVNGGEKKDILIASVLNNDAQLKPRSKKATGNPTEIALIQYADSLGINIDQIRLKYQRINEIPFSSDLKYMATIHQFDNYEKLIVKGAPEKIFAMCDNRIVENFKKLANDMAKKGLRLLAIAQKDAKKIDLKKDLYGLEFLGLIGIQDPLRPQAKATVNKLKNAGIRVVLVTGDHKDTALSIARQANIVHEKNGILTGEQLDKITDAQLKKEIDKIDIFARVDPRHKIRIVYAWQARGKSVAMTGDGVNDAPALKAADIGVALGSGSDVAHEISDMVLLDNNLSTIDAAVKEGRTIFDNIRKVITYLMVDSFGEIVLIGGSLLIGLPLPLLASQILWINLITDGPASLALTVEPSEPEIMKEKPKKKNENILNREMKILIFIIGIITDIGLFALYLILLLYKFNLQHIRTIIFTAFAINSLFYVFSIRSMRTSIFRTNPFSNIWLLVAVVVGFFTQISAIYLPPLQKLFSTIPLNIFEWGIVITLALVKIVAIEITKDFFLIKKKRRKNIIT